MYSTLLELLELLELLDRLHIGVTCITFYRLMGFSLLSLTFILPWFLNALQLAPSTNSFPLAILLVGDFTLSFQLDMHPAIYTCVHLFLFRCLSLTASEITETCNKRFWIHLLQTFLAYIDRDLYCCMWYERMAYSGLSISLVPPPLFRLTLFESNNQSIATQIAVVYHTHSLCMNIEYKYSCSNFR